MKFRFLERRKRRRKLDQVAFATVIGEGTTYRGDFSGPDNYAVHGRVVGACHIEGHLVIKPGGQWSGDIVARHVIVAGEVTGDVRAAEKLELAATAHIRGDIAAPVIALSEGAKYDGQIQKRSRLVRFGEKRASESA